MVRRAERTLSYVSTANPEVQHPHGLKDEGDIVRVYLPRLRQIWTYAAFACVALVQIVRLMGQLRRRKIQGVVGFGGYPSLPLLVAAWFMRVPILLHEQNALLGRVNRLLAGIAYGITTSFPQTLGLKPSLHPKVKVTGNPVRPVFYEVSHRGEYPHHQITLLILGGSQGAKVMADHVAPAVARLSPSIKGRLEVFHQARAADVSAVKKIYEQAGITATVCPFFEHVAQLMGKATLVISRAGASTLSEMMVVGCPALLIPYRYAMDDHQTVNGKVLASLGAALIFPESPDLTDTLARTLENMLSNQVDVSSLAKSMGRCKQGDAASALVDAVQGMVNATMKGIKK